MYNYSLIKIMRSVVTLLFALSGIHAFSSIKIARYVSPIESSFVRKNNNIKDELLVQNELRRGRRSQMSALKSESDTLAKDTFTLESKNSNNNDGSNNNIIPGALVL